MSSGALRELERAQWLSPAELQRRAEARLDRLLRHAATHVPFYREAFRRLGLDPTQAIGSDGLRALPVLGKSAYRERPEEFFADNVPAFRRVRRLTSGSSGEPFGVWLDLDKTPPIVASRPFYDSWFGLGPLARQLRVSTEATPAPPLPSDTPLSFRLKHSLRQWLRARYLERVQERMVIRSPDGEHAERFWRRLEQSRPEAVIGYTSTLAFLAGELLDRGLPRPGGVRAVIAMAETLSPERRRVLERYFDAPIINRYGLNELGCWVAQCCPEAPNELHVNTELVVHEVLAPDGAPAAPGEVGQLVLTDLLNYAMPLIRYDTGDLAAAGADGCRCGRGFPRLRQLAGRSMECLRTPAGATVSPVVLGHYLMVIRSFADVVRHYQLVQEQPDRVRLLVVPDQGFDDRRDDLRSDLAELLGDGVAVTVETVREIPLGPSGKRPIIKLAADRS